ncbi:MAG TPA: FtsW/RodA/SpoVE family cell cycle protein [Streptosporangiaceae bacterium]|jgi:rod shape determining protein RodA|nr:FtsW/RodA/SpoVE family cell cycle protein [Streptosporangiaceae bacterium]
MSRRGPVIGLTPVRGLQPLRSAGILQSPATTARNRVIRVVARAGPLLRFDWILMSAVLALGVTGVFLVWSASRPELLQAGADPQTYLKKQLLNLLIGLIPMAALGLLGESRLRAFAPLAYLATLVGLVAVLSPLGTSVNGASAWISLPGGFQVEPSEFAKLGLILITARLLSMVDRENGRPSLRAVAGALACAAPAIILVAAEPALGVTMLLGVVLVGLIVLSGTRPRLLAALGAAVALAALASWRLRLLKPYQLHRLASFMHPAADPAGASYSAAQSKIAVGSGGLLGQGLFHGQLINGNFIPEQHTDFIFAVAGEELGYLGALTIIVLLGIVIARALLIAARADDLFGLLVASGIAIWFAAQAFINIGMTVGMVPVTGLPLPLVSYGGSAMIADLLAVGALQAIRRRPVTRREHPSRNQPVSLT